MMALEVGSSDDILRAKKRSSERIAMALMRSTATAFVNELTPKAQNSAHTIKQAPEAEEQHFGEDSVAE